MSVTDIWIYSTSKIRGSNEKKWLNVLTEVTKERNVENSDLADKKEFQRIPIHGSQPLNV